MEKEITKKLKKIDNQMLKNKKIKKMQRKEKTNLKKENKLDEILSSKEKWVKKYLDLIPMEDKLNAEDTELPSNKCVNASDMNAIKINIHKLASVLNDIQNDVKFVTKNFNQILKLSQFISCPPELYLDEYKKRVNMAIPTKWLSDDECYLMNSTNWIPIDKEIHLYDHDDNYGFYFATSFYDSGNPGLKVCEIYEDRVTYQTIDLHLKAKGMYSWMVQKIGEDRKIIQNGCGFDADRFHIGDLSGWKNFKYNILVSKDKPWMINKHLYNFLIKNLMKLYLDDGKIEEKIKHNKLWNKHNDEYFYSLVFNIDIEGYEFCLLFQHGWHTKVDKLAYYIVSLYCMQNDKKIAIQYSLGTIKVENILDNFEEFVVKIILNHDWEKNSYMENTDYADHVPIIWKYIMNLENSFYTSFLFNKRVRNVKNNEKKQ